MQELGITVESVKDFDFASIVLGAAGAPSVTSLKTIEEGLVYAGRAAHYVEVACTASEVELVLNPEVEMEKLDQETIERRLFVAFSAANAQRRDKGGLAAKELLANLRKKLGVTTFPQWDFEEKGNLLYQEAYLYWLNNSEKAGSLFEQSVKADEQWTRVTGSAFPRAKAAMSRIVGARTAAETLVTTADGSADPAPDRAELERLAKTLEFARTILEEIRPKVRGGGLWKLERFDRSGVLHLAQVRAWLGDEGVVDDLLVNVKKGMGAEIDTGTELGVHLGKGILAHVQGRFDDVIPLLEGSPEFMLKKKAGEQSGMRAQLLAIAHRNRGRHSEFTRWCHWLVEECPRDAANGPAIDWAKANLEKRLAQKAPKKGPAKE